MSASRAPIRWRFLVAGAGAVTCAAGAGAAIDRALVLADVVPPVRFVAATASIVLLLVLPLLWSLERWVIRPLEALDGLHDPTKQADPAVLRDRSLPREVAEVIDQHTALVKELSSTNTRLKEEVARRTEVQEVLISAADALSRMVPGSRPADALLPILARLEPHGAAAFVHREDTRWVLSIRPPAPVAPQALDAIEATLQRNLGQGHRLLFRWLTPAKTQAEPIHTLRILVREPVQTTNQERSPAALVLLSTGSSERHAARHDLQRVLGTIGAWIARVRPGSVHAPQ